MRVQYWHIARFLLRVWNVVFAIIGITSLVVMIPQTRWIWFAVEGLSTTAFDLYRYGSTSSKALLLLCAAGVLFYPILHILSVDWGIERLAITATGGYRQHVQDSLWEPPPYGDAAYNHFNSRVTWDVTAAIRLRLAQPEAREVTVADRLAARREGLAYLRDVTREGQRYFGLRDAHAAEALNAAVHLAFIPTDVDVLGGQLERAYVREWRRRELVGDSPGFYELLRIQSLSNAPPRQT